MKLKPVQMIVAILILTMVLGSIAISLQQGNGEIFLQTCGGAGFAVFFSYLFDFCD